MFRVALSLLGVCLGALGIATLADGPPILGTLLLTAGAAGIYLPLREEIAFSLILLQINRKHGTRFTRSNGFGIHLRVYFDPDSRKILITDGSSSRIEDFSALRAWRLKWKSSMRPGRSGPSLEDFRIQLEGFDSKRPDLEIRCRSKEQGEFWHAKLNSLLNPPLLGGEQRA